MTRPGVHAAKPGEFAAERKRFIGGSDVAAILGVSTRRTPFDVWAQKTGAVPPQPEETQSDEAAAGLFLEPFIRDRFEMKTGLSLYRKPVVIERGFLGAHVDDLALQSGAKKPFAVFEAKTRSPFQRGLWGDEGTDQIPDDEMAQVQWYMHLTGYAVAYAAVLFDRSLSIFRVAKDSEFGYVAEEAARKFWHDYVETGKPPALRGSLVSEYVARRFPHALEDLREPSAEERELVRDALEYAATEKASKAAKEEARAHLKLLIGKAEGLKADDLSVYYRDRAGKRTTDYKAVITELRNDIALQLARSPKRAALLIKNLDASLTRFTKTGESYRDLRLYTSKGADE